MHYRGYLGTVHYNDEDGVFRGKLEGITDATYEGTDVAGLKRSFHEAVDRYLASCEKAGRPAEAPFKGSFNVRVRQDLHKRAVLHAAEHGKKLNTVVREALEYYLNVPEGGRASR
jgi:predicted HicB family RNase H-like nuclease